MWSVTQKTTRKIAEVCQLKALDKITKIPVPRVAETRKNTRETLEKMDRRDETFHNSVAAKSPILRSIFRHVHEICECLVAECNKLYAELSEVFHSHCGRPLGLRQGNANGFLPESFKKH